jgi:formylmethanofuran dehydrogenase subunit E
MMRRMMQENLWEKAVSFHGHGCPGLAIGVRASQVVMEHRHLGKQEYGSLMCVTEDDACGVDAVQYLLGCSVGKGNLVLRHTGKMVFTFINPTDGEGIRVGLKSQGMGEGMTREERQDWLLSASLGQLFKISTPKVKLPKTARIFKTVTCEVCGEGVAEFRARLEDGKTVCLDCQRKYSRGF